MYGPHDPVQCNKRFADPTALLRHRKNAHGYVPGANKAEPSSSAPETLRFLPYQRPTGSKRKARVEEKQEDDSALFLAMRNAIEKSDPSTTDSQYLLPREAKYYTFMTFWKDGPLPKEQRPASSYQPVTSTPDLDVLSVYPDSQSYSGSPTSASSACSLSKAPLTQGDLDKLLVVPSSLEAFIGVQGDPLRATAIEIPTTPQPSINFSQLFAARHNTPYSSPTSPEEYTSFTSNNDWPSTSPAAPSPSYSPFDPPSECFFYSSPASDATSPSACSDLSSPYWPAASPQPIL